MEAQNGELTVVFIGSSQKKILFGRKIVAVSSALQTVLIRQNYQPAAEKEHVTFCSSSLYYFDKLCAAALKSERHASYQDTYYLTYKVDNIETVIELVDPGVEHTGAREMTIRKAHGAMLFYSVSSKKSYNRLYDIVHDFQMRKGKTKPPIILIGIEEEVVNPEDGPSECTSTASVSEGYESEPLQHPLTVANSPRSGSSTEVMRSASDDTRVTSQQGQRMAELFGRSCKFMTLSLSSYGGTLELIEGMIRTMRSQQEEQRRNLMDFIRRLRTKKSLKNIKRPRSTKACNVM